MATLVVNLGTLSDSVLARHLEVARGRARLPSMSTRPGDTSPEAWHVQQDALSRIGPAARFQAALELSDAIRSIQIEGVRSRHPEWGRRRAVRHIVLSQYGIDLPETP